MSEPLRVLFVCTANICRSPHMEIEARRLEEHAVETIEDLPDADGPELVAAAGRRRTPPRADGDITDPYRRGAAAAEAATGTITSMLSVVVPRLVGAR